MRPRRAGRGKSATGYTIEKNLDRSHFLGEEQIHVKIRAPSGRLLFKLSLTIEEWKKFIR